MSGVFESFGPMSCHIVRARGHETYNDLKGYLNRAPGAEYVGSELLAGAVGPARETPAAMLGVPVRAHAHIAG